MNQIGQLIQNLVVGFGYPGLALGLILGSSILPIPSEVLLPVAGAVVHQGGLNMWAVIAVGTIAQAIGAVISYWIGARYGLPLIERYGKYVFFSERELAITQRVFDRYGQWVALVGRCVPIIRTYVGYPAGIARMSFIPFVLASLVGSLVWTVLLVWLGFMLGAHLGAIAQVFQKFDILVIGLLLVGVFWYLKRHMRTK